MNNRYDNAFKTNAVAVVRSGYGVRNLARRLGISAASIENWLKDPRFSDVKPAGSELMMSLLPDGREPTGTEVQPIVRIGCPGTAGDGNTRQKTTAGGVTVRFGRLRLDFHDGITSEQLTSLVRSLGQTGVL